jgi:DNA polymerase-3 subunit alpha
MSRQFVHLRVHTEYSLIDSVVRIPALVARVAAAGMPAVAVTDHCNVFGMVKFYRAAENQGVKPIIGADLTLCDADDPKVSQRLTVLCRNVEGYHGLSRLLTRAYLEGMADGSGPRVSREWVVEEADGLIALSGAMDGDVGQALTMQREPLARQHLDFWLSAFGDRYYLELERIGRDGEQAYLEAVLPLAAQAGVPVVATNAVCFLEPDDFDAHEARVCIHDGYTLADGRRPRRHTQEQFFRSGEQMAALFEDLPEALDNTLEIAMRCNVELELGKSVLPDFPVPAGMTENEFLASEAGRLLEERLQLRGAAQTREAYAERLARELDVIQSMGFAGYFLIVADFVRWARANGVPVGPGRGSGAGSLVAYALAITDLDPLEFDLLFERFLNPERVSMPDFDIDFCMEGRDRVIEYVAGRYGRERVAQIITYGSMNAKAVVRDAGRVMGHPHFFVDRIAKLIPGELGITLEKALEADDELKRLYREDEAVRGIMDLARSLEGLARNAGKHAGGVVIAPTELTAFTPLCVVGDGEGKVTQLDKDDVEAIGLVKFDFLGLRTLTIIDRAVRTIDAERQARGEEPLDLDTIPMEDAATFELLKRCDTVAVFQLESRGMRELIKRLQPDRFEDIIALVALFRPGPLQSGMVDDFIQRKHGHAEISYPHPDLESILEPTYGVILYQEQVMQIAQVLARYSLGAADLLRRAMGKKKPEEMAKQRDIFMRGALENGVQEATATYIFDLMEKFAGYGFNKSHSAAYAMLSYQTAWLKAHHPAAFMAAVLSADLDFTDKIMHLVDTCREMQLTVAPPDVNASDYFFTTEDGGIRYGLGAIKGVGHGAVQAVIEERERNGPYASLRDLCERVDLQRVNRRVLEALIRAGGLDSLGPNRATLDAELADTLRAAEQAARASAAGQDDLFGLGPPAPAAAQGHSPVSPAALQPEWPESIRLRYERDALGLYLTGHPFAQFEEEIRPVTSGSLGELQSEAPTQAQRERAWSSPRRSVRIAGLLIDIRKRGPRTVLTLDDRTGRMEVTLYDELFQRVRNALVKDTILVVECDLRYDDYNDAWSGNARNIMDLDQAWERFARRMDITWHPPAADDAETAQRAAGELRETLAPYTRGECRVNLLYRGGGREVRLALGDSWRVRPTQQLMDRLHEVTGGHRVKLVYVQPQDG